VGFVLRSGDVIANPVTGERLVVRATARDSGGERFEVERFLPPDHPRQPERVHPRQETQITVVRGVAGFKLEGKVRMALPGERLLAPAGARHQLWNAGGDTLHVRFELARARGHRPFPEDWASARVPSGVSENSNRVAS
jgi:quercetin dioxygenase-like cupin family protein